MITNDIFYFITENDKILSPDNIKMISYTTNHKLVHNHFQFLLYRLVGLEMNLKVSLRFPEKKIW